MAANSATCEAPRPFRPATATRMVSLEPSTRPDDLVPARVTVAAAASVPWRKLRRVKLDIVRPRKGGASQGRRNHPSLIADFFRRCKELWVKSGAPAVVGERGVSTPR